MYCYNYCMSDHYRLWVPTAELYLLSVRGCNGESVLGLQAVVKVMPCMKSNWPWADTRGSITINFAQDIRPQRPFSTAYIENCLYAIGKGLCEMFCNQLTCHWVCHVSVQGQLIDHAMQQCASAISCMSYIFLSRESQLYYTTIMKVKSRNRTSVAVWKINDSESRNRWYIQSTQARNRILIFLCNFDVLGVTCATLVAVRFSTCAHSTQGTYKTHRLVWQFTSEDRIPSGIECCSYQQDLRGTMTVIDHSV